MPTRLLSSSRDSARANVALGPDITLRRGRVHEACGPARRTFALWLAGQTQGMVLWISPAWWSERLNPDGIIGFADPARFLFATPDRVEDLLWATEEALRSGTIPLVIADLPDAPGLTPVRRLHLAAETPRPAPLGLLLTPQDGGAQGVETRWHMAPAHQDHTSHWHLERRRARSLPPQSWTATQTRQQGGLELKERSS